MVLPVLPAKARNWMTSPKTGRSNPVSTPVECGRGRSNQVLETGFL